MVCRHVCEMMEICGTLFNLRRLQAKTKVQTGMLDEFLPADDMDKNTSSEAKCKGPSINLHNHLSRDARKPGFGVSDQVRHKPAVQSQKRARSLKFRI